MDCHWLHMNSNLNFFEELKTGKNHLAGNKVNSFEKGKDYASCSRFKRSADICLCGDKHSLKTKYMRWEKRCFLSTFLCLPHWQSYSCDHQSDLEAMQIRKVLYCLPKWPEQGQTQQQTKATTKPNKSVPQCLFLFCCMGKNKYLWFQSRNIAHLKITAQKIYQFWPFTSFSPSPYCDILHNKSKLSIERFQFRDQLLYTQARLDFLKLFLK